MHALESLDFYSLFHPRWYESVAHYTPDPAYLQLFHAVFPKDWKLVRSGIWYGAHPGRIELPDQGWKLHVSVRTRDAKRLLARLFPILLQAQVPFKFLLDPFMTTLSNGKVWPRSAGGKFVTIYPRSQAHFMELGNALRTELDGFEGPYILSDRRWPGSKCLFYRYGGFSDTSVLQSDGSRKHVITSPQGEVVVDDRKPYWNPPAWVKDPFASDVPTSTSNRATFADGRFSILSALLFSNRGGVYKGLDHATQQEVILKEARPLIEVGSQQSEAIHTLEKEYRILQRLAGTGFFVQPVHFFHAWEHAFLVEAFVPGIHLGQFSIVHNPIYSKNLDPATIDHYFTEIKGLWHQLAEAIAASHELGIILGDLSFTNLMVHEGRICICDLETATEEGGDAPLGLRTPGLFDERLSEKANDYYALGVLMFGCLILSYGIVNLFPPSLPKFLQALTHDFGLPPALSNLIQRLVASPEACAAQPMEVVAEIASLPFGDTAPPSQPPPLSLPIASQYSPAQLSQLRTAVATTVDGIVDYLMGTATLDRPDRLFPSDMMVFETNPFSVAYGAMGGILAIHHLKQITPLHSLNWVTSKKDAWSNCPPGLYIGQSGMAWGLSQLGLHEDAAAVMRDLRNSEILWQFPDLMYGAAGYGMACLRVWKDGCGDEFLQDAVRVGRILQTTAVHRSQGAFWPDAHGKVALGYAQGGSGIALFLLYLHVVTQEPAFLHLGRAALDFDLHHGVWLDGQFSGFPTQRIDPDGEPVQSAVLSCYWDLGSAGVGTTLLRYLALHDDETLQGWLPLLVADASRKYTAFPQLFRGLAGLGNFLLDVWCHTLDPDHLLAAWQAAEGVLLFQVERPEGIVFPGDQLRRESADFATGSAGIGLFLHRLLTARDGVAPNFNFVLDDLLPHGLRRPVPPLA